MRLFKLQESKEMDRKCRASFELIDALQDRVEAGQIPPFEVIGDGNQ